jgi:hypothetical protein
MYLTYEEAIQNARDSVQEELDRADVHVDAHDVCPFLKSARFETTPVWFSPFGDDIPF